MSKLLQEVLNQRLHPSCLILALGSQHSPRFSEASTWSLPFNESMDGFKSAAALVSQLNESHANGLRRS